MVCSKVCLIPSVATLVALAEAFDAVMHHDVAVILVGLAQTLLPAPVSAAIDGTDHITWHPGD